MLENVLIAKEITRALTLLALLNTMVNFSENTYISAENSTNHLQSKGKEKAKENYKNNKERLQEQARNKYREWSNEEKNKKENMEDINIEICQKKINKY